MSTLNHALFAVFVLIAALHLVSGSSSIVTAEEPVPLEEARWLQDDEDEDAEYEEEEETEAEKLARKAWPVIDRITAGEVVLFNGEDLHVKWDMPEPFYQDVKFFGRNKLRHTDFRYGWLRPKGQKDTPLENKVCFAANTSGSFLMEPVFEGRVEVQVDVYVSLLEKKSMMLFTLHDDEKNFLGCNFGVHLMVPGKKRPKMIPAKNEQYHDTPNRWFDRTPMHTIKVVWDPRTGLLESFLNGNKTNSHKVEKAPERGRVGFRWKGAKFTVIQFQARGKVHGESIAKAIEKEREEKPIPEH